MNRTDLRRICNSLNPGGQTKLARRLGWSDRTVRNKIAGKSSITLADELAIQQALKTQNDTLAEQLIRREMID
jgi:DNA-binding transcriptional regulator YdaS (Cro superfamily)